MELLFYKYVQKKKANNDTKMKTTYNFKSVFTDDQEASFVEYIKIRARIAYGLSQQETRQSAYDFAIADRL